MVNTCDFCNKKIEHHVFCSASCKVRFHRGDKKVTVIPTALNTKTEVVQELQNRFSDTAKEGYKFSPMLGKYVKV
jgi:hypothetical protein